MGPTARAAYSLPFLWLGALLGSMAVAGLDTCTGGAADSLFAGYIVLALNAVGFLFLWKGTKLWLLVVAVALPMISAIFYSIFSIKFAWGVPSGMTACTALLGEVFSMPDGSEAELATLWVITSLTFWIALVICTGNSLKLQGKETEDDY